MEVESTTDNLVNLIEQLKSNVLSGKYNEQVKQELIDFIEPYITGEVQELDRNIIKYLVQGWWMNDAMDKINSVTECNEVNNEVNNEMNKTLCPLCFHKRVDSMIL